MSAAAPLLCQWDGDAFVPAGPVWKRRADESMVVGERYMLEPREPRSQESHNHYFAIIHEAWQSLPDDLAERFPTEEHLRKFALVKAGYRDERTIACSSRAEALRLAAFIKPMDDFAVITTSEATVTVFTAKSQSMRAMGKPAFQKSKDEVLDAIAAILKVDAAALKQVTQAA